jgi:hypothetical protein
LRFKREVAQTHVFGVLMTVPSDSNPEIDDWGEDSGAPLPTPETEPDRIVSERRWLTVSLVALLAANLVGAWIMLLVAPSDQLDRAERFISSTYPAVIGLVGAATGFYYANRR